MTEAAVFGGRIEERKAVVAYLYSAAKGYHDLANKLLSEGESTLPAGVAEGKACALEEIARQIQGGRHLR